MLTTGPMKLESNVVLAFGAIRPSHCWTLYQPNPLPTLTYQSLTCL
jgi:hypothetical protein